MVQRLQGEWQKVLWRILTHPTFEVVVAILAVLVAIWVLVDAQLELRHDRHAIPLLFGQK